MENTEILKWKKDVLEYNNCLKSELLKSVEDKNIFYGFEAIDGKIVENPTILFMGINPGRGGNKNEDNIHEIKIESDEFSYLDVFWEDEDKYKYDLAEETIKVLNLVGFNNDKIKSFLKNECMKTNFFNIVTTNQNDIKKTFTNSNYSYKDYYNKSAEFSIKLIKITKPKIVILEGLSVYNDIIEQCYGLKNTWQKDKFIGYYFSENENIHFVGYSRIWSRIKNKNELAIKLKKLLITE